jgi:hypothetical protein
MSDSISATKRRAVENTFGRPLTFILEPWADEYPMAAGERFILEANGPVGGDFTIEQVDDYLIAWAWDGSDARILREDGTIIDDWTGLRVPDFTGPTPMSPGEQGPIPSHPSAHIPHSRDNGWRWIGLAVGLVGMSMPLSDSGTFQFPLLFTAIAAGVHGLRRLARPRAGRDQ